MISFSDALKLAILLALIANIAFGPEENPIYQQAPPVIDHGKIYNYQVNEYVPPAVDESLRNAHYSKHKWIELTPFERKQFRRDYLDEDDVRDIVNETMD